MESAKKQDYEQEKAAEDYKELLNKAISKQKTLNPFSSKRLVKGLYALGYRNSDLAEITNEIQFEILCGSLIKSNITGEPLSVDHAINVALKLVREQRWSKPLVNKKHQFKTSLTGR